MNFKKTLARRLKEENTYPLDLNSFLFKAGFEGRKIKRDPVYRNVPKIVRRSVGYTFMGALILVIGAPMAAFIIASFETVTSFNDLSKNLNAEQRAIASTSTFRPLNEIKYTTDQKNIALDADYVSSVNSFASKVFFALDEDDMFFSPLSLYTNLDMVSLASGDEETTASFDEVLGLDQESRGDNIANNLLNNYFVSEAKYKRGTVRMKQGCFLLPDYEYSTSFLDGLTSRRAETFTTNFFDEGDYEKMIQWVNDAMGSSFVGKDDFPIVNETFMYLMSTLYFDCYWKVGYNEANTSYRSFYLDNGTSVSVPFMMHAVTGELIEQEDFVAFTDYYETGYSIQYFVPKSVEDSILTILRREASSGIDFLQDYGSGVEAKTILYLPKFQTTQTVDFTSTMCDLGLSQVYNLYGSSLSGAFVDPVEPNGLAFTRQKNRISFSEDGTKIETVTYSMGMAGAAAPSTSDSDIYKIELNQPFVYCVRDTQGVPIFLGYESDPSK